MLYSLYSQVCDHKNEFIFYVTISFNWFQVLLYVYVCGCVRVNVVKQNNTTPIEIGLLPAS